MRCGLGLVKERGVGRHGLDLVSEKGEAWVYEAWVWFGE